MTLSSNVNDLATRIATEFNTVRTELAAAGASVYISETAPTDPLVVLWFNSANGVLYIRYDNTWISQAGATGLNGISAYEVAVENGFTGTEVEWLASLVGAAGASGIAATVTVGTTTTGNPGTNASVTNSGTTSAAVLNFTIPQGADGADGAPGASGITIGNTAPAEHDILWLDESATTIGPIATISVTAPITNSGNTSNAVIGIDPNALNFAAVTPLRSNNYYTSSFAGNSSFSPTQNNLYFMPFFVPTTTTVTRLGAYVSSGNSSANLRFGIYNMSSTTDEPTSLVVEGSSTVIATAGFKYVTLSQSLTRGWYYLAVVLQQAALVSLAGNTGSSASGTMPAGTFSSPPGSASFYTGYYQTLVSGSLPATASGYGYSYNTPKIFVGI